MSKYRQFQYELQPKTYKTVMRVIDEFYEECSATYKTPTLNRLIVYVEKHIEKVEL